MPRDTPYSGVAAIFRSSLERGEAPRVFEDGGQMRDFVHVADVARANAAAIEAVGRPADRRRRRRTTSAPATPVPIRRRGRRILRRGPEAAQPDVTGQYRARRRPPRRRLARAGPPPSSASPPQVTPEQGLARVRHRAAARPERSTSPARSPSRCCTTRATTTWSARGPSGATARAAGRSQISSQGTNGSQIALDLGLAHLREVGDDDHRHGRRPDAATGTTRVGGGRHRSARRSRRATPAKASGPALKTRAARLPHIQYSGGRLRATPSQ